MNKEQKLVVMYQELIFTGIKVESWKVAEVTLSSQGLKQIRKIVYLGIENSKKDCLCQVEVGECENWKKINFRGKIVYPRIEAVRKCCLCID